jgi:hypothetical protein
MVQTYRMLAPGPPADGGQASVARGGVGRGLSQAE